MNFSQVLSNIVSRRREREAAVAQDFDSIVSAIVDDRPVDEETIEGFLEQSGTSPEDFAKAVEAAKERRRLAGVIAEHDAVEAALRKLNVRSDEERKQYDAEFNALKQKYHELGEAATAERNALMAKQNAIATAKAKLRATADPALMLRSANLGKQAYALDQKAEEYERWIRRQKGSIAAGQKVVGQFGPIDEEIKNTQGQIDDLRARAKAMRDQAAEAEATMLRA